MPSSRAIFLLSLGALLLAASVVISWLAWAALLLDVVVLFGIVVDSRLAARWTIEADRRCPPLLAQGEAAEVVVGLRSDSRPIPTLRLREALHPRLAASPVRTELSLDRGAGVEWRYRVTPRRRGVCDWGPLTARWLGPMGLGWAQRDLIDPVAVRVFPRVRWGGKVGELLALARRRELGQSPSRFTGDGAEPYALRVYRRGDPPRKIHWRATARQGRLITREETWEQGARLVILLDCGRGMASTDADRSKLDHALATSLALLRLAVGRGDRVTLVAYSDRIERQVRVRPGVAGVRQAYAELYDLEARLVEPALDHAVEAALRMEPRRAHAVLCTSVVDLAASERLQEAVLRLQRRHQTLLVNLEDPRVASRARCRPENADEAFAKVAAMEIQLANRRLARRLRSSGVNTVTTAADRLTLETLDAYLEAMGRTTRRAG